jgi:chromosome segregation ATPase
MTWIIVGGTVVSLGGSLIGASSAKKARRQAERKERALKMEMDAVEKKRSPVINPYAGVQDLSDKIKDLSGMIDNPYDNLGVATQAAEIQMEQSDIALANTLDTLAATGASAGGATALAQAALASKKGVAASIESQEANNEKLRAQGEATLQQQQMAEAQRVQEAKFREAGRLQEADVAGRKYVYEEEDRRTEQKLNRLQSQITGQQQQQAAAREQSANAIAGGVAGMSNILAAKAGA